MGQPERVLAVPPHPEVERAQPAQRQPRLERAQRAARPHHPVANAPDQLAVARRHARHQVRVPAQVLGDGVHDEAGAQLQRAAEDRGGERVVHEHRHVVRGRHPAQPAQVGDAAQRVGDRLRDRERCPGHGGGGGVGIVKVHHPDLVAQRGEVAAQHREGDAVRVRGHHHRRRPGRQGQDRGEDRGHPRGAGLAGLGALELGHGRRQRVGVLVRVPTVDVAGRATGRDRVVVVQVVEDLDRRLDDRRGERVARPQLAAGVDRPRVRPHRPMRRRERPA